MEGVSAHAVWSRAGYDERGWVAFESYDGIALYQTKRDITPTALWSMPVSGGEERLLIPSIAMRNFAVGRSGIYFIDDGGGKPSIRYLAFATAKGKIISPILSGDSGLLFCQMGGRSCMYRTKTGQT